MWSTPCWTTSRSRPGRRQHLIRDLRIDRSIARSMPSRARLRSSTYVARSGAQVFFTLQAAATTTITCIVLHSRSRNWYRGSRDFGIEKKKNTFFFLLFSFSFFFFLFVSLFPACFLALKITLQKSHRWSECCNSESDAETVGQSYLYILANL